MAKFTLKINGKEHSLEALDDTPLLWVLRDVLGMTGTKYGCGIGLCAACTVHADGVAVRSCTLPVSAVQGMSITTVEGLADGELHPVQEAWIAEQVPQCGYCQPGQMMTALAFLKTNSNPSDAEIDAAMSGALCRCGTYPRIRRAVSRAARALRS